MLISIVIPAYNASSTIHRALSSIHKEKLPLNWRVEVIVVDDGSSEEITIKSIIVSYPNIQFIRHEKNLGMCASRNSGIIASKGDLVTILDADDELVTGWYHTLQEIIKEWPSNCNLCFVACQNQKGNITATAPDYTGYITLEDILNENYAGEYLPIFKGKYVRKKLYIDLSTRKSCGILSYIKFAQDAPFWVSNKVLRIYHENQVNSVSIDWTNSTKAKETVICYKALFEHYGGLYQHKAPRVYKVKKLKLAVYLMLAGSNEKWHSWRQGASLQTFKEALLSMIMLLVGRWGTVVLSKILKKIGMIKRYG